MSTARLFAPPQPYAEIERQRDLLQVRNAELRITLDKLQLWLQAGPVYEDDCIRPDGWDDMRKLVDEVLK